MNDMSSYFRGRVVLITGASSGIGEAAAMMFAVGGDKLVLTGKDEAALGRVKEAALKAGAAAVLIVAGDLTEVGTCERIIHETATTFHELHVLVNNAGFMPNKGSIEEVTDEDWAATFELNLNCVRKLSLLALDMLVISKGSIINVSSVVGCRPRTGSIAYCVSKGGLDQMTKCMALELAHREIRVNSVNPGVVRTKFKERSLKCSAQEANAIYDKLHGSNPLGRVGEPDDVAGPIVFLASKDASWITGTILNVDGGMHCLI